MAIVIITEDNVSIHYDRTVNAEINEFTEVIPQTGEILQEDISGSTINEVHDIGA